MAPFTPAPPAPPAAMPTPDRPEPAANHGGEPRDDLFVQLITANHDHLRRYIYTLLPHEQDAQDVMQEVCLTLSQKFSEYDRSRPFLPWACGFAYLKVLQHRDRNPRRTVLLPVEVLELVAREREAEEPVLAERLVALERCLAKLGRADRDLIKARYIDRISPDDIARRLAVSRRTTFRNLERVRRLLFDCVGRSVLLGKEAV
jgi:RNA polymerase sigma-70 factor, ECF subfamily